MSDDDTCSSGIEQAIIWTEDGPVVQLADGRTMFIKLQTPENPPVDYEMRRYSDDPVTYEYGSYKVTSDHYTVDLILTEDLPEAVERSLRTGSDRHD